MVLLRLKWSQSLQWTASIRFVTLEGCVAVFVYVMNANAGEVYFGSFGCWWFSWCSINCSKYTSRPARLKNQILQTCMLNYLTAVVMLMNLKRLFRNGELLPSNNTCRIGVLKDETKDMCISSLEENKITFKSILHYFYHSRNQVCLATEIGLIIVDFYFNWRCTKTLEISDKASWLSLSFFSLCKFHRLWILLYFFFFPPVSCFIFAWKMSG